MLTFAEMVDEELVLAKHRHPGDLCSLHEAYAVILEELDEFWEQVRLRAHMRDDRRMLKELVQAAAMCRRTAEDLGLIERVSSMGGGEGCLQVGP